MIRLASLLLLCASIVLVAAAFEPLGARSGAQFENAGAAREALETARNLQRDARARAERFEQRATRSREAADKATDEAAALAARVQQAEAAIASAEAREAIAVSERRKLDRRLAERREPLVRLTGALQSMSRRPLTLSALQPGSLRDLVFTRAVLDSAIPQVRLRTAALRGELDRARSLESEARAALADRREAEAQLSQRRANLVAAARRERLAARAATGGAAREAQRALVLAEQARDLDALVGQIEQAGSLRQELAALPGPLLRPDNPGQARRTAPPTPRARATAPPDRYLLPVAGKVVRGFGEAAEGVPRQSGITLFAREGAQAVAPAAGRIVFAGPYRGYDRIVIVEHANGWTSLVTGLAALDVGVGQQVAAGSPIGRAGRKAREIALELRRDGDPVNPLDYLR